MSDRDRYLASMVRAYLECAAWADAPTDENGAELELDGADWGAASRELAAEDCADFARYCAERGLDLETDQPDAEQAGHDFWLSRNGHGAGFFDRAMPRADEYQSAARAFGSRYLYVADSGALCIA